MGRKRKTRWRRLSIGEVSANEDEEDQESEIPHHHQKSHSLNSIHRHRSASTSSMLNSNSLDKSTTTTTASNTTTNKSNNLNSKMSLDQQQKQANGFPKGDKDNGDGSSSGGERQGNRDAGAQSGEEVSSNGGGGDMYQHHNHHQNHYSHYNSHHQYNNGYHHNGSHHQQHSYNGGEKDNGTRHYSSSSSYHNGHPSNNDYSNNYYHRSNSYNNYRNSHYDGGGGHGGRGGGGGSSDYHFTPSRFADRGGGRFRKPRPYSSNYNNYYGGNGPASPHPSSSSNGETTPNPNTPSYNQDEYTKITTPRQDVLFKKGYLSQRKPVTQSTSLESTSTATTPSASTNGTPDTHSTTGINSDYSEGYEISETDCGVPPPPYDDTLYYGPPADAVFTDANTGQIYYGQCSSNGEYFDAYPVSPVMLAGYSGGSIYYQLAYPPMDWNGVPQMYPVVAAPPPLPIEDNMLSSGVQGLENGNSTTTGDSINKKNSSSKPKFRPTSPETQNSTEHTNGEIVEEINTSSDSKFAKGKGSFSSNNSTTVSSISSKASTPLSPPGQHQQLQQHQHQLGSLPTLMSNLSLNNSPHHHYQLQTQQQHPSHLPPIPNYLVPGGPPTHPQHHHHQHHHGPPQPNSPYMYPHPGAGFVYASPVYNGVVVPLAPAASATTNTPSSLEISSSCSRKKRKKRRRKKDDDDGQVTDESYEDTDGDEANPDEIDTENPDHNSTIISTKPCENPKHINPSPQESPTETYSSIAAAAADSENVKAACPKIQDTFEEIQLSSKKGNNSTQIPTIHNATTDKEVKGESGKSPKKASTSDPPSSTNSQTEPVQSSSSGNSTTNTNTVLNKKPPNLTVLSSPLRNTTVDNSSNNAGGSQDFLNLLQISPTTLEPSSPDSFNTTQSVAGSEIASVSESDLMNRTTSLDEVEEDLPVEDESDFKLNYSATTPVHVHHLQETQKLLEQSPKSSQVPLEGTPPTTPLKSKTIPIKSIPKSSSSGSTEPSPSPETTFESQIEPTSQAPFSIEEPIRSVRIPLESLYFPPPDSEIQEVCCSLDTKITQQVASAGLEALLHSADEVESIPIVVKKSDPIVKLGTESITQAEVAGPGPELEVKEPATSSGTERPKSITLAVTEWLKTQGEDALTPASQLVAQFAIAAAEDNDGDIEDSEEGEHLDDDDEHDNEHLTESEKNQKNLHGNPWVLVSSNKKNNRKLASQRNRSTARNNNYYNNYYSDSSRRDYYYNNHKAAGAASSRNYKDGICSRVASSSSSNHKSSSSYPTTSSASTSLNPVDKTTATAAAAKESKSKDKKTPKNLNIDTAADISKLQTNTAADEEDSGLDLSSPEHLPSTSPILAKTVNASLPVAKAKTHSEDTKRKGGKSKVKIIERSCDIKINHSQGTEPESNIIMSSSSFDECSSSCISQTDSINCDPQKYAIYYQFGVVVEQEEEKDQGIDSGSSATTTPSSTPPQTPMINAKLPKEEVPPYKSNTNALETEMAKTSKKKKKKSSPANRNLTERQSESLSAHPGTCPTKTVMKHCDFENNSEKDDVDDGQVIVQDEDIGTFVPQNLKSAKSKRGGGVGNQNITFVESSTPPEINEEDYKEFVHSVSKSKNYPPHLYVNPLSLAAELVYTANANKVKLPDSWDLDSTESPLPLYESPSPPPNLLNYPPSYSPVFNHLTPREKLIRTQLQPYGYGCSILPSSATTIMSPSAPATHQAVCCTIQ